MPTIIAPEKILPLAIAILIIIAIAIISQYSKTLAAIVSVMPINIPLGMWVAVAGQDQPNVFLADFSRLLAINIIPTLCFIAAAWWIARSGYTLLPTILGGYIVWGVALALVFVVRNLLGF